MMRDQLRHLMATLSVFLVSIGLMGATPKKSEAGVGVAVCTVGGVIVVGAAAYCIWSWWTAPPTGCAAPPACAPAPGGGGGCGVPGAACGAAVAPALPCACTNTGNLFTSGCACQ